jgi:hypothetical protein
MRTSILGRPAFLAGLLLVGWALAACGGSGGWDFSGDTGILEVRNSDLSAESIVEVRIIQGLDVQTVALDIAPGSFWRIGLDSGVYDVQITWSDAVVDVFPAVVILDGVVTPILGQEP